MSNKKTYKKKKEPRIPLWITDTTLRDAHQSLWATRMKICDIMEIVDVIDSVGGYRFNTKKSKQHMTFEVKPK